MLQIPWVHWVYVAWFVLLAALSLILALRPRRRAAERFGMSLHVLMCVAMATMTAPSYMDLWWLHGFGFLLAAAWFVWMAVRPGEHDATGDPAGHSHGRVMNWYHAFMMAAMSWMTWIMLAMQSMHGHEAEHGSEMHHHGHDTGGFSPMIAMLPSWMLWITIVVVAVFALALVAHLWQALRVRDGSARLHAAMQAAMALGMGFGFVGM